MCIRDRHVAPSPDAPDADDLAGEVDEPITLQEDPPVLGEGGPVVDEDALEVRRDTVDVDAHNYRRVLDDDAAVRNGGERVERPQAVPAAGLREDRLEGLPTAGGSPPPVPPRRLDGLADV